MIKNGSSHKSWRANYSIYIDKITVWWLRMAIIKTMLWWTKMALIKITRQLIKVVKIMQWLGNHPRAGSPYQNISTLQCSCSEPEVINIWLKRWIFCRPSRIGEVKKTPFKITLYTKTNTFMYTHSHPFTITQKEWSYKKK